MTTANIMTYNLLQRPIYTLAPPVRAAEHTKGEVLRLMTGSFSDV